MRKFDFAGSFNTKTSNIKYDGTKYQVKTVKGAESKENADTIYQAVFGSEKPDEGRVFLYNGDVYVVANTFYDDNKTREIWKIDTGKKDGNYLKNALIADVNKS